MRALKDGLVSFKSTEGGGAYAYSLIRGCQKLHFYKISNKYRAAKAVPQSNFSKMKKLRYFYLLVVVSVIHTFCGILATVE